MDLMFKSIEFIRNNYQLHYYRLVDSYFNQIIYIDKNQLYNGSVRLFLPQIIKSYLERDFSVAPNVALYYSFAIDNWYSSGSNNFKRIKHNIDSWLDSNAWWMGKNYSSYDYSAKYHDCIKRHMRKLFFCRKLRLNLN